MARLACAALALGAACAAPSLRVASEERDGAPRNAAPSFRVANDRFERDGAPFTIMSGSFHYHRAHESTWNDRLQ